MIRCLTMCAAVVMAAASTVSSAAAQSMPRYDPESYCTDVSDSIGGSAMIYNGCLQQEQSSYDTLKRKIGSLPARTVAHCDEVASSVGGTYQILEGCIDQELGAAASTPGFRF